MPQTETNGVNNNGRDNKGRFTKGNAGGPGNPFARKVAQLPSALVERVTEQDIKDIAEALILQARTGDHAATTNVSLRGRHDLRLAYPCRWQA